MLQNAKSRTLKNTIKQENNAILPFFRFAFDLSFKVTNSVYNHQSQGLVFFPSSLTFWFPVHPVHPVNTCIKIFSLCFTSFFSLPSLQRSSHCHPKVINPILPFTRRQKPRPCVWFKEPPAERSFKIRSGLKHRSLSQWQYFLNK